MLAALAAATPAVAAISVRLTATTVRRAGVLRLAGNATQMPMYALPAARMPCARYGTCPGAPPHRSTPPKRPFVFLGTTPSGSTRTRAFAIRLPRTLPAGRYKIFVWCKPCGGSLIVAGIDASGQTLHVLP